LHEKRGTHSGPATLQKGVKRAASATGTSGTRGGGVVRPTLPQGGGGVRDPPPYLTPAMAFPRSLVGHANRCSQGLSEEKKPRGPLHYIIIVFDQSYSGFFVHFGEKKNNPLRCVKDIAVHRVRRTRATRAEGTTPGWRWGLLTSSVKESDSPAEPPKIISINPP